MSDEVRIGSLRLKFLIDDTENGGKLLTVTLDGVAHRLKSGDALFVPRGAVHRFDNLDAGDARALVTLTPAVAGKRYFEDIAAVVNAGGPPDMAKVKAVMDKYGLVVA